MLLRTLSVTGAGIFGRRFTIPIGAVHMVTGPNDAGKSTVLIAIGGGLRGLATIPSDTSRPYIGDDRPDAAVTLSFDGGQITRDLAPTRSKAVDLVDAQVAALLGNISSTWNLDNFAQATDAGRQKVLDAVITAGGLIGDWSVDRVIANLTAEVGASDLDADPLAACIAASVKATSPDGWLSLAKDWYGPGKGTALTLANAATSAAEAATKLHPADEEPPTGTRARAEARVAELLKERDDALAAVRLAEVAAESAAQRVRDEERLLGAVRRAVEEAEEAEAAIPLARAADLAAVKAADARNAERLEVLTGATTRAKEALAAFRLLPTPSTAEALGTLEIARAELEGANRELAEATKALAASVEAGGALRATRDGAKATLATLEGLAQGTEGSRCQHCDGADPLGLGWRIAGAREAVETAEAALTDARAGHAALMRAETLARADLRLAEAEVRSADADLDKAKRAVTDHALKLAELEQSVATTTQAVADYPALVPPTPTLPAAQARLERARAAQISAEVALTAWRAEVAKTTLPTVDADHARRALAVVDGLLLTEEALVEAHRAHDQREADRQAALGALAQAVARQDRVKAIGKAIDGLRQQLAEAAHGPIAESVTGFLAACGLEDRFFIDDASSFGLLRKGKRISFYALSDSSRALVGAALAVTFAGLSKSRWPVVMIDRLEAVDPERVPGVLAGLVRLQAEGKIAQAICAMRYSGAYVAPEGVTVQQVGGAS